MVQTMAWHRIGDKFVGKGPVCTGSGNDLVPNSGQTINGEKPLMEPMLTEMTKNTKKSFLQT